MFQSILSIRGSLAAGMEVVVPNDEPLPLHISLPLLRGALFFAFVPQINDFGRRFALEYAVALGRSIAGQCNLPAALP